MTSQFCAAEHQASAMSLEVMDTGFGASAFGLKGTLSDMH